MSSPLPTTTVLFQLSGLPTPMFSTALLWVQNTDSLGLCNATRLQTKKLKYSRPRLSYVTRYTAGYPSHLLKSCSSLAVRLGPELRAAQYMQGKHTTTKPQSCTLPFLPTLSVCGSQTNLTCHGPCFHS